MAHCSHILPYIQSIFHFFWDVLESIYYCVAHIFLNVLDIEFTKQCLISFTCLYFWYAKLGAIALWIYPSPLKCRQCGRNLQWLMCTCLLQCFRHVTSILSWQIRHVFLSFTEYLNKFPYAGKSLVI